MNTHKLLCYSVISALFLSESSIASVYELQKKDNGTLEELDEITVDKTSKIKVKNQDGFIKLINKFDGNNLPSTYNAGDRVGVTDNFEINPPNCKVNYKGYITINPDDTAKHNELERNDNDGFYKFDLQMLGAAVWFHEKNTDTPQQVYVAKKIPYSLKDDTQFYTKYGYSSKNAVTTSYADANSFKKRTDVDHTERQLIAAILSEKNITGGDSGHQGTMCIYTKGHPCCDDQAADAGNISCVNYYKKLAQACPNIKFYVFFHKAGMATQEQLSDFTLAIKTECFSKILSDLTSILCKDSCLFLINMEEKKNIQKSQKMIDPFNILNDLVQKLCKENSFEQQVSCISKQHLEALSDLTNSNNLQALKNVISNFFENTVNKNNDDIKKVLAQSVPPKSVHEICQKINKLLDKNEATAVQAKNKMLQTIDNLERMRNLLFTQHLNEARNKLESDNISELQSHDGALERWYIKSLSKDKNSPIIPIEKFNDVYNEESKTDANNKIEFIPL